MTRWPRLTVHDLRMYDMVSAVHGIIKWNISLIYVSARLFYSDTRPRAIRHTL